MKLILIFTLSVLIINLECYSDSIHTNDTFSIIPPKLTQSDDGRILTFYLKSENGFAPNVNILIRKFNGTMEEYYEKTRFQAKSLNFQIIKSSFENNQSYFEYIGKLDDNQVHFYTKYVKNGEQIYVITATSLDIDWDKKKTELIKSVNSFNLNKISE
jgi:hypothetical protein